MRQMVINDEFRLFRVYQNESEIVGRIFVNETDDKASEKYALTRTGSARYEQVRHFTDIAVNLTIADVLPIANTNEVGLDFTNPSPVSIQPS